MRSGPTSLLAEAARGQDSTWTCPQGPLFLPQQPSCSSKGLRAKTSAGCSLSGAPAYLREAGLRPGVGLCRWKRENRILTEVLLSLSDFCAGGENFVLYLSVIYK